MATKRWISKAIKRPGALRGKAKRAGMSTRAFATAHRRSPGRLGKQSRLALTLGKLRKRTSSGRKATRARRR